MDPLAAIAITLAAAVLLTAASMITSTKARAARQRRRDQMAFRELMAARTAAAHELIREINSQVITREELRYRITQHNPILQNGWTQP